jgi:hypothetical protein
VSQELVNTTGSQLKLATTPETIGAGDEMTVYVTGVTNPSTAGAKTLTLSTGTDPKPASVAYTLAG